MGATERNLRVSLSSRQPDKESHPRPQRACRRPLAAQMRHCAVHVPKRHSLNRKIPVLISLVSVALSCTSRRDGTPAPEAAITVRIGSVHGHDMARANTGRMMAVYAWYPDRYCAKNAFRKGSSNVSAYIGGDTLFDSSLHSLLSRPNLNDARGAPNQGANL